LKLYKITQLEKKGTRKKNRNRTDEIFASIAGYTLYECKINKEIRIERNISNLNKHYCGLYT